MRVTKERFFDNFLHLVALRIEFLGGPETENITLSGNQ